MSSDFNLAHRLHLGIVLLQGSVTYARMTHLKAISFPSVNPSSFSYKIGVQFICSGPAPGLLEMLNEDWWLIYGLYCTPADGLVTDQSLP